MEYVIAILLVIIIYYLYKANQQREVQVKPSRDYKAQWDELWTEYIKLERELDNLEGLMDHPYYSPFIPPIPDKFDRKEVEFMQFMVDQTKKKIAKLREEGAIETGK